ncbi:MAG: hypothetical protein ACI8S6_005390 [Myxococcota bacterium]|jgi:hypothetical protein
MPDLSSLVPGLLTATGAGAWGLLLVAGVARTWTALCERTRYDVDGRWIVVTGCDSGFGRGVVGELVDRGAQIVAMCLTPEGAREALAQDPAHAVRDIVHALTAVRPLPPSV